MSKGPTLEQFVEATQTELAAGYNRLQSETIRESAPGTFREPMEAMRDAMRAIRMLETRLEKVHAYSSMRATKAS